MATVAGASRKLAAKFYDRGGVHINIRHPDFGAKGDSVNNDTQAIADVADALGLVGGGTMVIPPAEPGAWYKTIDRVALASHTRVVGSRLAGEVRCTVSNKGLFSVPTGVTGVRFKRLAAWGFGDYSAGVVDDSSLDRGVNSDGALDVGYDDCLFRNFALAGVYHRNTPEVWVKQLKIEGTHTHGAAIPAGNMHQYGFVGVSTEPYTGRYFIDGLDVSGTAFGVDLAIEEMIGKMWNIHDIPGQHAVYNGARKFLLTGLIAREFNLDGFKSFYGTVGVQNFIVLNNFLIESSLNANAGIDVAPASGGTLSDIVLANGIIRNPHATPLTNGLGDGIDIAGADRIRASNIEIFKPRQTGLKIATYPVNDGKFAGIDVIEPGSYGFIASSALTRCRFRGCDFKAGSASPAFEAMRFSGGGDDISIDDPGITGDVPGGSYWANGIANTAATNFRVKGGQVSGYGSKPVSLTVPPAAYENVSDGKEYTAYTTTATVEEFDRFVAGSATGGAFTITVPTAVGRKGRVITFKKVDASANAVTVSSPSVNIDGVASKVLATQWDKITIKSNGSTWLVVG